MKRITTCAKLETPSRVNAEFSIVFVDAAEIASVNERYLDHSGPTDVITFDYRAGAGSCAASGDWTMAELFVCLDIARSASEQFGNSHSREVILYLVHGVLHLCGYDDHDPQDRRRMKQREQEILCELDREFDLDEVIGSDADS